MTNMFIERDGRLIRLGEVVEKKEEKEVMRMLPNGEIIPMSEYLQSKQNKGSTKAEKKQKNEKANELTEVEQKSEVIDEALTEEKKVLGKKELQNLLKENNVKFHHFTGKEKLEKIAKENNLI